MKKKQAGRTQAKTKGPRKGTVAAPRSRAAVQVKSRAMAVAADDNPAVAAQTFAGVFRFPGKYAFLEKFNIPDYALLQANDPFTGHFDELAAENTSIALQSSHQDGDPATLTGKIVTCDVEGRQTPVLFMFNG